MEIKVDMQVFDLDDIGMMIVVNEVEKLFSIAHTPEAFAALDRPDALEGMPLIFYYLHATEKAKRFKADGATDEVYGYVTIYQEIGEMYDQAVKFKRDGDDEEYRVSVLLAQALWAIEIPHVPSPEVYGVDEMEYLSRLHDEYVQNGREHFLKIVYEHNIKMAHKAIKEIKEESDD